MRYKKAIKQYFSRSRVIIIVCLVLIFFLSVNLAKEVVNRHQINETIKQYEAEVVKLEKENQETGELIESWETGRPLEKEARLKLGLQKPGENTILILRDENQPAENTIIDPNSEVYGTVVVADSQKNASNFKNWWQFFFNCPFGWNGYDRRPAYRIAYC